MASNNTLYNFYIVFYRALVMNSLVIHVTHPQNMATSLDIVDTFLLTSDSESIHLTELDVMNSTLISFQIFVIVIALAYSHPSHFFVFKHLRPVIYGATSISVTNVCMYVNRTITQHEQLEDVSITPNSQAFRFDWFQFVR